MHFQVDVVILTRVLYEHFNYVREIVCDEIEKNQSYYEPYISTDFYLHVQSMRKNKGGSIFF
jgi:hypothetical protein